MPPLSIPAEAQYPWNVPLANHLGQLIDPAYGGLRTFSTRPSVGTDGTALAADHRGYTIVNTSTTNIEQWDGTAWVILIDSAKIVRAGSIDFYINKTTGSDSNTGLTPDSPWKSEAKLYKEVFTYNFLDAVVNIHLGAGAYTLELPPNTNYSKVNIIGVGSGSVKLGVFTIRHMQNVCISGLTLSEPGYASNVVGLVTVTRDSMLHIGPDVVLGDAGQFVMYLNGQGTIRLYPNCPIQVTGQCFRVFNMNSTGTVVFMRYLNTSELPWGGMPYQPSVIPPLSPADTVCDLNFIGTLRDVYNTVFYMQNGSSIQGYQNKGSLQITGNTSNGLAYMLFSGSFLSMNTVVGTTAADRTIAFPATVRQGYVDASSPTPASMGVTYNI